MKEAKFKAGTKVRLKKNWKYRDISIWDTAILSSKLTKFTISENSLFGVHLVEIPNLEFNEIRFEICKNNKIKLYNYERNNV